MGLKERRFAKQFAEEQFPALEAKIKEAIGFEVPLEIAWETLFEEQFLHLYNDTYPKIYFIPFIEAFKIIGKDQIAKKHCRKEFSALKFAMKITITIQIELIALKAESLSLTIVRF